MIDGCRYRYRCRCRHRLTDLFSSCSRAISVRNLSSTISFFSNCCATYTRIRTRRVNVCMHVSMQASTWVCVRACMHAPAHPRMYGCACVCGCATNMHTPPGNAHLPRLRDSGRELAFPCENVQTRSFARQESSCWLCASFALPTSMLQAVWCVREACA